MSRSSVALSAALLCLARAPSLHADTVTGTRSGESLYETAHTIDVTLHRGWAELIVRRTVQNDGKRHDQALFFIDVPGRAVATGLSTLGTLAGRPHWFAGNLMEAEAAAEKYRELTGIGGYYPKDPALLSWRSQERLALQVFPVAPDSTKSVEYRMVAPLSYRDGAYHWALDTPGSESFTAKLSFRAADAADRVQLDRHAPARRVSVAPAPASRVSVRLIPAQDTPLSGELAVATAGTKRVVTRLAVEAAPHVAHKPKGAYVVIAIDRSHSISDSLLDAERAAARAYLSHLPDAHVQILSFDRKTQLQYAGFVGSRRARADLAALSFVRGNGSAVDVALQEADRLLARAPAGAPRRIVLMTDDLLRSNLKSERVRASVTRSGAIVHMGVMAAGTAQLMRSDEHRFNDALRSTGGLVWRASAAPAAANLAKVYEEWVRPLRIDHLSVYSPDIALGDAVDTPAVLLEGQGHEQLWIANKATSWVRVEGELWARPVQHVLHASAASAKRWAALTFSSSLLHELSEPEMMRLAQLGGAVSPVTSYLAIEPGVRPSTEGLDWGSGGGRGFGASAPRLRMGATKVTGITPPLDRDAWLSDQLGKAYRACGGRADTASVSFETTRDEIVDVQGVTVDGGRDALLERCLSEATWALQLPVQFWEEWNLWTVRV